MTVLEGVPPAKVHTVAGELVSRWRAVTAVPSAALTSATVTMAQVTLELGRGGGRPLAGSPADAVAVAVFVFGEPRCARGAFFAHAPSATATTITTTAHHLADMRQPV